MGKELNSIESELRKEGLESQVLPPDTEVTLTPDGHRLRYHVTEPYFSLLEQLAQAEGATVFTLEEIREGPRLTTGQLHKAILYLRNKGYITLKRR